MAREGRPLLCVQVGGVAVRSKTNGGLDRQKWAISLRAAAGGACVKSERPGLLLVVLVVDVA